ncbi:MAG TPA: ArsC family reductase [Cytophagaceae bacterium]|jgi:arsenate reductase|nr:ArsC family reductase [Cytophagaceae bacterium]
MIVYGIKNCDTVKKATTWLNAHHVSFDFYDYKTQAITESKLKAWCAQVGWEVLLNKKGTTWRNLDENTQASVTNEKAAIAVMLHNTSIIKRPVIENKEQIVVVGFDEKTYLQKIK